MQNNILRISIFFLLLVFGINLSSAQKSKKQTEKSKDAVERVSLSTEERRLFNYYFYEAINAKAIDEYDSQYDYLEYCHQIDSTNANVLFELGNLYSLLQDKETALSYFQKAVKYDNENYYYKMALGSLCLETGEYPEAIEVLSSLVKTNPDKIDLYLYLSESHRLNGDIQNAIKALNDLEKIVGLNERISFQKFQLYSAIDKKKEAYAEMQKYIDKYPNEIKYYILLGNLYLYDDKTKEALDIYEKARVLEPENPYLVVAMTGYYEKTDNKEAAEKELHSALFNPKLDVDTKLGMLGQYIGTLQQQKQSTERTNVLFDSLMVEYPQEAQLNLMYGNLLMLQEKKEDARFQFQIYAESEPTNPLGWEQLLKTVFPDSVKASIEVCEKAISYIPDNPIFYIYLATGHNLDKNEKKALEVLQQGIRFVKEDNPMLLSEFYGQMGDVYHQMDVQDSAFIQYERALKYNPQNLGILNNYSYYLSLQKKDLDKAEKMSSITIKAEPTNPTYLDTYGWILFEQGAYTTAKIYLENAVKYSEEAGSASSEVYEHYGDVLYKMDNKEKAIEYWKKAKDTGESDSKILDRKIETGTYIKE